MVTCCRPHEFHQQRRYNLKHTLSLKDFGTVSNVYSYYNTLWFLAHVTFCDGGNTALYTPRLQGHGTFSNGGNTASYTLSLYSLRVEIYTQLTVLWDIQWLWKCRIAYTRHNHVIVVLHCILSVLYTWYTHSKNRVRQGIARWQICCKASFQSVRSVRNGHTNQDSKQKTKVLDWVSVCHSVIFPTLYVSVLGGRDEQLPHVSRIHVDRAGEFDEDVTMLCKATGNPAPHMNWWKYSGKEFQLVWVQISD